MLNSVRGEVQLTVGKRTFILCLSLGALAEIETELKIDNLQALDKVFAQPKARDLAILATALIHGGASDETDDREAQKKMTLEDVMALPVNMKVMMETVKAAFTSMNDEDDEDKKKSSQEIAPQNSMEVVDEMGAGGDADVSEDVLEDVAEGMVTGP